MVLRSIRFLSSVVHSLPCRGLSLPLLSLFLDISLLFFLQATINRIIVLCCFSVCSMFMWSKATDFFKLILYPASLLKLFMVSKQFFWWSFSGFLGIKSCYL
jgi:hypothetical protein